MQFKDLGLVIVDEEQRFGVEHKEHLKKLRTNVDVLTMSATPIPRTLEMAVTGIREMSTITTPPEERHPVLTFVGAYDEQADRRGDPPRAAARGPGLLRPQPGRVDRPRAAARLRELVPEARIPIAHGQMNEHALEQVIVDFWEKEFDVLVCTTIVESGIDIANANTLIVERADKFGLSQLHQLRGRVGRGRERAYAYFLYPPEKPLTETAHDRLATIAQNTELGAGMQVAMKDLEIRGAGNLLGGEQSGHIAGVGFDLYVRLVGEAVADFRGRRRRGAGRRSRSSCRSTRTSRTTTSRASGCGSRPTGGSPPSPPTSDVAGGARGARRPLRPAAAAGREPARGGPLPGPRARRAGLTDVTLQGTNVRFAPVELPESGRVRLARLYPGSLVKPAIRTILVPRPTTARVGGTPLRDIELLAWAREVIDTVIQPDGPTSPTASQAKGPA